jgi:tetratricopeptide (TPR) repeat protein
VLAIAVVLAVTSTAHADADLAVFGPIDRAIVRASERAGLGKPSELGASCASDVTCLKATGSERGVRRVLGIALGDKQVELVLVDIIANDQLGRRVVKLRDLASSLRKFVDEAPTERAKELFVTGNQHYQLGEFGPALELYRRAYQVKPLAEFLFNIAQCHRKLGQHKEAIAMYQSYLVGVPSAENKPLVDELIAESRSALADADRRETDRLAAERADQLRRAREAEAIAAAERRRAEQARSQRRVVPWLAIGIGAAAVIGGGLLYMTSETDDGTQPTYRDTRPAGIGVAVGGLALAGTGALWVIRF